MGHSINPRLLKYTATAQLQRLIKKLGMNFTSHEFDKTTNLLRTPDTQFLSNALAYTVRLTEKYKITILNFSDPLVGVVTTNKDFHNDKLVTYTIKVLQHGHS
jgi:hypothetical protein